MSENERLLDFAEAALGTGNHHAAAKFAMDSYFHEVVGDGESHMQRIYADIADGIGLHAADREAGSYPLRVGHIHSNAGLRHAPTGVVTALVRHTDRSRFEPYVYLTDCWWDSLEQGASALLELRRHAKVRIMAPPKSVEPAKAQRLADLMAKDRIDIAVLHTHYDPITVMVSYRRIAPLMVGFAHGSFIRSPFMDHYVALSDQARDNALEIVRDMCEVVALGSDIHELIANVPAYPRGDQVRIGTIGSVFKVMDHTLLTAMARALKAVPHATWTLAGRADPAEIQRLDKLMREHGVHERVLYAGEMDRPQIAMLLKSLDVYVNSFPESGGVALSESMGAGLPVVTLSGFRAKHAAVQHIDAIMGDTGVVVDEGRACDFPAILADVLTDATLRHELGCAARARYDRMLTGEAMAHGVDALLDKWWAGDIPKTLTAQPDVRIA